MTAYVGNLNLNTIENLNLNTKLTLMATYMSKFLNGDAPLNAASGEPSASAAPSASFSDASGDSSSKHSYDNARFTKTTAMDEDGYSGFGEEALEGQQEIPKAKKGADKPKFKATATADSEKTKTGNAIKGRESIYDRGWFRPALIGAGVTTLVVGSAALVFSGGDEQSAYVEAGSANAVSVDASKDGRDSLSVTQAQYIAEQQKLKAEKDAKEGVTNAVVISSPEAQASENTYLDENVSKMISVTQSRGEIPRTTAQMRADADLVEEQGRDGGSVFRSKSTGVVFFPVDAELQKRQQEFGGATYQQSYNSGSGGSDYGTSGGGAGGTGGGSGSGGAYIPDNQSGGVAYDSQPQYQQQQQQQYQQQSNYAPAQQESAPLPQGYYMKGELNERLPDTYLQTARDSLRDEYSSYAEITNQTDSALMQREQEFKQQQQQALQERRSVAQQALSSGLSAVAPQSKSGFSSSVYFKPVSTGGGANGANGGEAGAEGSTWAMGNGGAGYAGTANYTTNNVTLGADGNLSNQQTNQSQGQGGEIGDDGRLRAHVLRAGTNIPVIVTKSVNTDEGTRVTAEIISGKFAGSKVYGTVYPTGRSMGIRFDRIAPKNPKKPLIPINAIANTIGTQKEAVATNIKRHYGQNYGILALTSILEGYGEAYSDAGQTSIVTDSGNVVTVTDGEVDSDKIRGKVIGSLGSRLTNDVSRLGNRAPTYYVAQGTVVNMVLTSNWDTTSVASDLGYGTER